ncbi:hypothetical protein B0H14DRAFT_3436963 [Mycena olivaceomarginata]|nr:hypothetical protein B0H14DRAFT_3436963 [Mycena olivaceomarginata]
MTACLTSHPKAELIVAAVGRRIDAGEVLLMGLQLSAPVQEVNVVLQADEEEDAATDDAEDVGDEARRSKWKKRTLAELFGGAEKKHATRLTQEEIDAEAELMKGLAEVEAQAEAEEDARLAVEIASEEEYAD